MTIPLRVTGYDKRTERLAVEHVIPKSLIGEARLLAKFGPDDDGLGGYPLDANDARALGLKLRWSMNPDLYDFFIEPAEATAA